MAHKLFGGGPSFTTSAEPLRALFSNVHGRQSVAIVTDRDTGQSRGFGFVEITSADAARQARW